MNANFVAGKPVTGKNLIGRENEIARIIQYLKNGDSIVLMAPRRFGKTSIILEVLEIIANDEFYTGYVDLFTTPTKRNLAEDITRVVLANKKLDNFMNMLKDKLAEILRNVEIKNVINDFEYVLDFRNEYVNEHVLLKNSINFIDGFAKKNDSNIVIAFDEFADINKLNGKELTKLFRSTIQMHKNSSYIFSGSYESMMNNIFIKKNSPFYRFAKIIELGFIGDKSFTNYLTKQFQKQGIKISNEAIIKILEITKGHPYYTQLLSQTIAFSNPSSVSEKDIIKYLEESLWLERGYFENVWGELSRSKENVEVILCIAASVSPYKKLNPKTINIARSVNNLKSKGLLNKDKSGIVFYDIFLLYWLQKNVLKTNIKV